jgi:hypothetical protein
MVSFKDIIGALGTILGYLGAEVAEESTFERLLWPQRYYNDISPIILLRLALLMPSGGPLHRAALETLSKFQENGLYLGKTRGNMLGSAFYRRLDVSYYARTLEGQESTAKETRNGFLAEISRSLAHNHATKRDDNEKTLFAPAATRRAHIPMHHMFLKCYSSKTQIPRDAEFVAEDRLTWKCFVGALASELTAIITAVVAGTYAHSAWLSVYFLLPLLFKILSFGANVHREPLRAIANDENEIGTIFELNDLNHGLILIQGPDHIVRQFCRHYGHPVRGVNVTANRVREITSMALVYLFVGYFPAGLIALLWLRDDAQALWLSYQLYVVFAMHVSRLMGLNGCARTEERIARFLKKGEQVILHNSTGPSVTFRVETVWFENVSDGQKAVSSTIAAHKRLCQSEGETTRSDTSCNASSENKIQQHETTSMGAESSAPMSSTMTSRCKAIEPAT